MPYKRKHKKTRGGALKNHGVAHHGAPQRLAVYQSNPVLSKQEQVLLNTFGNRLVKQQQGAFDTQLITENSCCQTVIGANAACSDQMTDFFLACRCQNDFQFSDFIAAIVG